MFIIQISKEIRNFLNRIGASVRLGKHLTWDKNNTLWAKRECLQAQTSANYRTARAVHQFLESTDSHFTNAGVLLEALKERRFSLSLLLLQPNRAPSVPGPIRPAISQDMNNRHSTPKLKDHIGDPQCGIHCHHKTESFRLRRICHCHRFPHQS